MLRRVFPFLDWFQDYRLSTLRVDLVAGATVGLVLVPQSMAYAQLAGLPAHYGLYASFMPPLIAALFGSSCQLATGPVAVVSLMTATALQPLATAGSEAFVAYAMLLALLVGGLQFLLGLLRLGMLVNFLSHPVVNGFTNAAALIIASSQLSKFFGVTVDSAEHYYQTIWNVLLAAGQFTEWWALGLGVLALLVMWGLKRLNPRIPYVLIAVVFTTLLSWAIGFEDNRAVDLTAIDSPAVKDEIGDFNAILDRIDSLTEVLVVVNRLQSDGVTGYEGRPKVCLSCHHSVNVGPGALANERSPHTPAHDAVLLGLELSDCKEERTRIRASLRAHQFVEIPRADDGSGPIYVLEDPVRADEGANGRIWRLKVGRDRLDKAALGLIGRGAVVGVIPRGLPGMAVPPPDLDVMFRLVMMAATIALLGFMEAVSIAKAIATQTGQRLDYNQELMGQGLANIAGSFTQSYPVSGSFSRSAVNFQSGAQTGLSSVITVGVVGITLVFFTPFLYHLPQSVLAAIIMMAVIGLVNVGGLIHAWQARRSDGVVTLITFVSTLAFAPHLDRGIMIGVFLSLALHLARQMRPRIAILSRHEDDTFRDSERRGLVQCEYITVIRFPSSLFFANASHLEEEILRRRASMTELRHVLIDGSGINELDASGEDMLSRMVRGLREAGCGFSLSGLNDAVLDVMRRTGLY
ncbi:MAG: SulP family inorganic anion transporter, partial [Candidatus Latescibacteria bacterium]|nr:SulP family inorganic anion transporter [Candidatus Latescibacterota bacterium]